MVKKIREFIESYRYWRSGADAFTGKQHTRIEALRYAWSWPREF